MSVPVPSVLARAEELHGLGDDIDRVALLALIVGPLPEAQSPIDCDLPSLAEEAMAVLALWTPDGDVEEVGLILPLPALRVPAPSIRSDPQTAD